MSDLSSGKQPTQQTYNYAAGLMYKGLSYAQIVQDLEGKGFSHNDAQTVLDRLVAAQDEKDQRIFNRQQARKKMAMGAAICLIGIAITIVTYSAASMGGGRYIIAYGAILVGGFRFLQGAYQSGQ